MIASAAAADRGIGRERSIKGSPPTGTDSPPARCRSDCRSWSGSGRRANAILRDWIDKLQFPEAFVVGLNIAPEAQQARQLPFVEKTCAISLHPVETEALRHRWARDVHLDVYRV
jgi:hypothetical protein